jgi:hypothetical protein
VNSKGLVPGMGRTQLRRHTQRTTLHLSIAENKSVTSPAGYSRVIERRKRLHNVVTTGKMIATTEYRQKATTTYCVNKITDSKSLISLY